MAISKMTYGRALGKKGLKLLKISGRFQDVMRPLCLVESHKTPLKMRGVLSVYLTTILYIHLQLFFDRKREYTLFHYCVSFIGMLYMINLYYIKKLGYWLKVPFR